MKLDIKKLLLAGTAIVAVSAVGVTAAKAADFTLTGNTTWGAGDTAGAAASDNVNLDGNDLAVDESDNTTIGAITDTNATPDGNVTFDSNAGDSAGLAVTVGSATLGTGNFVVQATENTASANGDATAVTVTGAISTGGNVTVTGGTNANNSSDAGDDATLTVGGNITAAGIVLTDGADGEALLVLNGSTAQTITGAITGDGDITVSNAAGVTFVNAVTATDILVEATAANASATFQGAVTANITLGGDATATDVNTVTFDGSTAGFTVTGTVDGAVDEVNNVVVTGGNTIVQATAWGGVAGELDSVSVTTSGTILDSNANITADAVSTASGTTLDVGAGTVTAAVTNAGTLLMSGAGDVVGNITNTGTIQQTGTGAITGDVSGAGTIDVDADLTVTGDLGATSADVATGQTLTVAGGAGNDIAVSTITLNGTGALDFTGGSNLTGNVVAAADGDGAINIGDAAATTAIAGNIGTSSAAVATLDIAGVSANVVTTTGNLWVDAITANNADTLSFIGTSAQAVSGTITGGDINVTNATGVTFNGVINSDAMTVASGAAATFAANATFAGALDSAGAVTVGQGSTLTAASFTDNGGTFVLNVVDADATLTTADIGLLDLGGAATVDTDDLTVNVTGVIGTGTVDVLANGGDAFDEAKAVVDNSALYTFTAATDGTLTVAQASTASITNNAAKKSTADNLLATTATGELLQVQNAFVSAGSADVNNVLEAAASDVSAGAVVGGVQVAGHTTSVNNQRLAAVRSGEETGMSAGQMMSGLKAWIQGFGATGEQDERDNVSGYDVDSVGFAVGLDTENVAEDLTVGVSVAYANTDVESDAISNAETEIDSYQIALYGDYDLSNTAFITAQLAYMWSDNETTRNPGGVSSLVANGDYDSDTFIANATLGNDYHMGHGSLVLTPSVSANYVHYSADSYTETGAGTANLSVNSDSMNIFELGLGVNAEWSFEQANGSWFKPSVGVGVRHDLIGDEYQATNQFAGSTTSFEVEGYDPAQTTFDAGVGFKYYTTDSWTISADYNYEFKSDFDSHAGVVKASYKF